MSLLVILGKGNHPKRGCGFWLVFFWVAPIAPKSAVLKKGWCGFSRIDDIIWEEVVVGPSFRPSGSPFGLHPCSESASMNLPCSLANHGQTHQHRQEMLLSLPFLSPFSKALSNVHGVWVSLGSQVRIWGQNVSWCIPLKKYKQCLEKDPKMNSFTMFHYTFHYMFHIPNRSLHILDLSWRPLVPWRRGRNTWPVGQPSSASFWPWICWRWWRSKGMAMAVGTAWVTISFSTSCFVRFAIEFGDGDIDLLYTFVY